AALQAMPLHLLVGQAALECAEQKTAEAPFIARDASQRLVLQQMLKKRLGEVLRVVRVVAGAAEVGVNWSPIDSAQLRHCGLCASRSGRPRGDDNGPRRLLEALPRLVRRAK